MKHFLPLLFAILLLGVQTGCKESTNTNNTSNDNTNMVVEQSPEESPGGGGGPGSSQTFPPDPNCTGMRTVYVGPNANVVVQLDNGNQELKVAGDDGLIDVPCTASYTVYR